MNEYRFEDLKIGKEEFFTVKNLFTTKSTTATMINILINLVLFI